MGAIMDWYDKGGAVAQPPPFMTDLGGGAMRDINGNIFYKGKLIGSRYKEQEMATLQSAWASGTYGDSSSTVTTPNTVSGSGYFLDIYQKQMLEAARMAIHKQGYQVMGKVTGKLPDPKSALCKLREETRKFCEGVWE